MEKKIALEKLKIERETEEEKIKMIHLKEQYARKMQRQQLQEQIQQRKQNNPNGGDNEILPTETNMMENKVLMSSGEEPDDPPSFKKTNFIIMIQTVILFALVIALVAI